MSEPSPQTGDVPQTDGPQTGDPVVAEALEAFRATEHQPLGRRAEAAVQAQRRLQERLAESAPGASPAAPTERAPGSPPSA